jgi:transcriptional regulator with XRE-family HTH domain
MVFSRNLASLVGREKSISEAARVLRISRSQLNRFLSGETYPRPDILQRICVHFGTDARILTTPLVELSAIRSEPDEMTMIPDLVENLEPVPQNVLPDGIYAEWMLSTVEPGLVEQNLIRIYSEGGRRLGKIRISVEPGGPGSRRNRPPMAIVSIQFFMQRDGFASIDRVGRESFHAFTAYRVGFGSSGGIYPGYKLSGLSHHPRRLFARTACALQRITPDCRGLLAAAREAEYRHVSEAPAVVQRVLRDVQEEAGDWHKR